jgi:hypothetical protein
MWRTLKKILGVLTDVLLIGRARGLWQKKQDPFKKKPKRGL